MKKESYLDTMLRELRRLKQLSDDALEQLDDSEFFEAPAGSGNSAAVLLKHVAGNLLSRWRDFLTTDGEKPDRDRDSEFVISEPDTREDLRRRWEKGWERLFDALAPLAQDDLERIVHIRKEPHTVLQAINRQITHYAYHTGQIVYVARLHAGDRWRSLSVERGGSKAFNESPGSYLEEKGS
jgi:uncharacterized damage-inducible protein DinB